MRMMTRAVVAAVTAVVLGVPTSAAGASSDRRDATPPPTIAWVPCAEDRAADCGTLRVPIDWSWPAGPAVDLAVARRRATDPSVRLGSLIINPGGPGGSGVDSVIFGAGFFSDEIRRDFDLVGFDPRGVARSHPVVCSASLMAEQPLAELTSQADFDRTVAYNRRLGEDCRRHTGPLFDHVDTVSAVRDIDAIRAAVGDAKLSFYGASYGTLMAEQYAELFPQRVRALVLDSTMDHSLETARFMSTVAVTTQDSFDEFVRGCASDARCALHGRDVRALFADLLLRAARGELHSPFAPDVIVGPSDLINAAFGSSYAPDWFGLADYFQALDAQTPLWSAGRSVLARSGRVTDEELAENPFPAIFCEDWRLPVRDYDQFAALRQEQLRIAPDTHGSPLALYSVTTCPGWPARVNNPQHPLRVHGSAPLLVVNALHDPATGYAWARAVVRQLGWQARLLTYEGWGHVTYGRSSCVVGIVDAYLVAGVLPGPDARCAGVPPEPYSPNISRTLGGSLPTGPLPGLPAWSGAGPGRDGADLASASGRSSSSSQASCARSPSWTRPTS
jgi:pimeloyl-ACP methyl ester carboxylesterase